MEKYSNSYDQLRTKMLRYLSIAFVFLSVSYLIIKSRFYWMNNWIKYPTAIGFGILSLILLTTLISILILCRQQKIHKWLSQPAPIKNTWIWICNLGWIISLALTFFLILTPEFVGWKDQADLFVFLTLVLFLVGLTLFLYQSEISTQRIWTVSAFLYRWKLFLLFIGLSLVKIIMISPYTYTLIVSSDGFVYWSMARHLSQGYLDVSNYHHYPPLYPLAIAPAFLFGERNSLMSISVINILISSAVVIPVYFIAKSFFSEKISILLAILGALNPFQWIYPAFVASENLYYLLFFCSVLFVFRQPQSEKNRSWWNLLTGIIIGLSWLTRYQTFPLIPIYLFAWWLKPNDEGEGIEYRPSTRKIFQLALVVFGIIVTFGIWVIAGFIDGVSLREIAGFHIELGNTVRPHPLSNLVFWSVASLAFFILMIGPVFHLLTTSLLHINSIKWNKKMVRWVTLAILTSGVLWFTIARHAWLANYNYEVPFRLVGRYAIYAEMVLIITAIGIFSRISKVSLQKYCLGFVLSMGFVYISYQVFTNTNWLFGWEPIFFHQLDGYTPLYLDSLFFLILIICGFILGFTLYKNSKNTQLIMAILTVIIIQLVSLPYYNDSLITNENKGRYINEIVDQIIQSDVYNPDPSLPITIYYPETIRHLDRQFRVKGVDISSYTFEVLPEYPSDNQKCEPFIQIDLSNGQKYGIMSESRGCKPQPEQTVISEFSFNQHDYFLAPITR